MYNFARNPMTPARPNTRYYLLLAAFNALLLAGAELFVRAARLDERLLAPLLYYQDADTAVHRLSADPRLHYELKPGAAAVFANPVRRSVTVNSLGFRGPERSAAKPAGARRLVFLGSSNTYGAAVGDADTYPARLEALLNAGSGPRWEVWNAGVSAYVLPQNLAAARRIIADYAPDLLVIQTHNGGRRPFLSGQPFMQFFTADRELFRENLRYCWPRPLDALRHSALARALAAGANRLVYSPADNPEKWNKIEELAPRQARELAEFYGEYGSSVPIAVLLPPGDNLRQAPPGMPEIRLSESLPPGHGPDFLKIHPPAEVYAWYARAIAGELRRAGLLSAGGQRSP